MTVSCRLLLPFERSIKNDEVKERRRHRSIKYEKVSAGSEQGEKETKPATCTVTSAPDNKVLLNYTKLLYFCYFFIL